MGGDAGGGSTNTCMTDGRLLQSTVRVGGLCVVCVERPSRWLCKRWTYNTHTLIAPPSCTQPPSHAAPPSHATTPQQLSLQRSFAFMHLPLCWQQQRRPRERQQQRPHPPQLSRRLKSLAAPAQRLHSDRPPMSHPSPHVSAAWEGHCRGPACVGRGPHGFI